MKRLAVWLMLSTILACHPSCVESLLAQSDSTPVKGIWVFKEAKVLKEEISDDQAAYFNNQFQLNLGNGLSHSAAGSQEYWRGYGSKDTHHGKIQNSHRWTVPPKRIAGDSEVSNTLEATSDIHQTNDIDLGLGCGTTLVMGGKRHTTADAGVPSTLKANDKPVSARELAKVKVGRGQADGVEMEFIIAAGSPGGRCEVAYRYRWDAKAESKPEDSDAPPADISGTWTHGTAGETWTFTPIAPGEYIAVEKGFGNAKGKATVKGNTIHIDYTTSTGKSGTYDVTIGPDGKSGKGTWSEKGGSSGVRDFVKGSGSSSPGVPPSSTVSGLTVRAGEASGNEGQVVDIPVSIQNPSDISNLNVVIEYDPSIVKVNAKPSVGSGLSNQLFDANYSESGIVRIGFAGSTGLKREGTIAAIPFALIGKAGSSTSLKVSVTSANSERDEVLKAVTVDGKLTILGATPDSKPPIDQGDTNDDGAVNALDALQALKMSVKLLPENLKADVDTDGRVTSNDARLILKKVVGAP